MIMRKIMNLIGLTALMSSAAMAATSTANLTSSASVTATCNVTGGSIAFGAYDPFAAPALPGTTTLSVTCTTGMTPPPVTMDQGQNPVTGSTGAVPLRQLSTQFLAYNLYSDAGHTVAWENVTGVTSPTPSGLAQTMNVYGQVAAAQHAATAGAYTDSVLVTVTF
jgi:spore coat protein U-like protein